MRALDQAEAPIRIQRLAVKKPRSARWGRFYVETCIELAEGWKMKIFWTMASRTDDLNECAFNMGDEAARFGMNRGSMYKLLKTLQNEKKIVYLKRNLWMISPRLIYLGHYAAWNLVCWRFDERLKGNLGALYPTKETPNEPCDLHPQSPDADPPEGDSDALAEGGR